MADRVKEFPYADDNKEPVDVINLLLIGWILLGLVVYILGNVIATQIRKRKAKDLVESAEPCAGTETSVKQTSEFVSTSVPKLEEFPENLKYEQVQAPVCSGEESDIVEWANNVFAWIYNQRVVSPILDAWLSALNARTRLLSTEHGILVDFQNVVHNNQAPTLTDAFETVGSRGVVNISCEAEICKLVFEVLVTQVKEKDKNVFKFLLSLHRLSGQLTIACAPEDLAFIAQFSESPQVELDVEPDSSTPVPNEESDALCGLVREIASEAFSSSSIDLRFSSSSECPKYAKSEVESNDEKFELAESEKEEKLLVKIIKASNIGGSRGSSKPYCVIEMDEPAQHFETTVAEDGSNPFWDTSFVFICKTISAELLFELYDKDKPSNENFLGLCIVSVAELMRNPSQRQIIPLQPRPLEKDDVSGTLITEFLFLDRNVPAPDVTQLGTQPSVKKEVDIQPGKTIETNSRVTAGGTIITTTTIKRTAEVDTQELTDTALKELEKQGKPTAPDKSTLIIHSVQRTDTSGTDSLEASPASHLSTASRSSHQTSLPPSPSIQRNGVDRSRPKEKKSLIGNLRKKLSFRKTRSKSMELRPGSSASREGNSTAPTERAKSSLNIRETSSVKSGRRFLALPGSTRSSFSEASGVSTTSSRTYINENSTLVIEINENGIIKRYLIPSSMIHRSKWKKKGVKLHLYNDHVFVAKHLAGSTLCQVCKKHLTRRPGKQGYECRDCSIQCHKSCHVKVAEYCPNSSVTSMEVEYIHDPNLTAPKSA